MVINVYVHSNCGHAEPGILSWHPFRPKGGYCILKYSMNIGPMIAIAYDCKHCFVLPEHVNCVYFFTCVIISTNKVFCLYNIV